MVREFNVEELIGSISEPLQVLGKLDRYVSYPAPIDTSIAHAFTFCSKLDKKALKTISASYAKVIICSAEFEFSKKDYKNKTLILVKNPRLAFIEIVQKFFTTPKEYCISSSALISENAHIHPNVYIGPHTYVGDCTIGEGSIIYGNVYIYSNVTIGRNVTIHSGTTIGVEDAFAYERNAKGELIKFPHFGGVIIEDDVDIHVHVNIDRGTFGNTIIGRGTKINRYAHIGHNGIVGKHCQIGGQCFVAGSCAIGDFCELALCSCVRNGTNIGKNVMVGMGSVVTKDVEDDWIVFGVPAKKSKKNKIPEWRNED
jgi:UDP-3-O-[3-hydroxymyristoyl] glucosamine N-acyltransferase